MEYSITIPLSQIQHIHKIWQYSAVYNNKIWPRSASKIRQKVFDMKSLTSVADCKKGIHYLPIDLAKIIADTYRDYIIGKWFDFKFVDQELQDAVSLHKPNIQNTLYRMLSKQSYIWYGVIYIKDNGNNTFAIRDIPPHNYYPKTDGLALGEWYDQINQHNIISVKKENWQIFSYVLSINKSLDWYTYQYTKHKWSFGDTYDANKIFNQDNMVEEYMWHHTKSDYLPIFVFNNDYINDYEDKDNINYMDVFGESDLAVIREIYGSLIDRLTMGDIDFNKNWLPKIILPDSFVEFVKSMNSNQTPEQLTNMIRTFERYLSGKDEIIPQYLTKDTSYLDMGIRFMELITRYISSITRIPLSFFNINESAWEERVGAINKKLEPFYYKIEWKRNSIVFELQNMIAYIWYILTGKYELPSIVFPQLKDNTIADIANEVQSLVEQEIISRKTAYKLIMNADDSAYDQERKQILLERATDFTLSWWLWN